MIIVVIFELAMVILALFGLMMGGAIVAYLIFDAVKERSKAK